MSYPFAVRQLWDLSVKGKTMNLNGLAHLTCHRPRVRPLTSSESDASNPEVCRAKALHSENPSG